MINTINRYIRIFDFYYISYINIIKNLFNKFLIMFNLSKFKFNILNLNKRQYTIYKYPKKYKNFKFLEYLLFLIKTDYYKIIEYYLNILNIYK